MKENLFGPASAKICVLEWILARCEDKVDAVECALGYLPKTEDICLDGTSVTQEDMAELLNVDKGLAERRDKSSIQKSGHRSWLCRGVAETGKRSAIILRNSPK